MHTVRKAGRILDALCSVYVIGRISDALCSVYVRLPLIPREGGVDLHAVIHMKSVVALVFMWLMFGMIIISEHA